MKIFRWILAAIVTIIVQFVLSILIYNLQHLFNLFSVAIIFMRYFMSVFIAVKIGLLIAPGNRRTKDKVFIIFYLVSILLIVINLFINHSDSVRISSATLECFGNILGMFCAIKLKIPIINRKFIISPKDFPIIAKKISNELRSLREKWFFSLISEMEKESTVFEIISPILVEGSNIDTALKGFQLTCIMGFCMKRNYIKFGKSAPFETELKKSMTKDDYSKCELYQERYLDCQGDIKCLENKLTADILKLLEYISEVVSFDYIIKRSVPPFAILSQVVTAISFGDEKTANELKKLLRF